MTASSNSAVRALRPSLVVAEALVDRQDSIQIVDRARKLGFSPVLTTAVVGVCCGERACGSAHIPSSQPIPNKSIQS
jgi:hypothetical protein